MIKTVSSTEYTNLADDRMTTPIGHSALNSDARARTLPSPISRLLAGRHCRLSSRPKIAHTAVLGRKPRPPPGPPHETKNVQMSLWTV